jgi:hypothetical protein
VEPLRDFPAAMEVAREADELYRRLLTCGDCDDAPTEWHCEACDLYLFVQPR